MFVSSTCYDLKQIRADLKEFIEGLGYDPFLSEFASFPVDPTAETVENCQRVVEEHADLFVLVIGGRYGSTTRSGSSITNLEYTRARAKGIPTSAFVQRDVLPLVDVWKKNPHADFSGQVDSVSLFKFIADLRDSGTWVFPFDTAADITAALRQQWAYLFAEALDLRAHFATDRVPSRVRALRGEALRIAVERPPLWEHRLLGQVLADELRNNDTLKQTLVHGLDLGPIQRVEPMALFGLVSSMFARAEQIPAVLNKVVNNLIPEALGPPGVPGDADKILDGARRIAEVHRVAIEWALEFRRIRTADEFARVIELGSQLSSGIFDGIEAFSDKVRQDLATMFANGWPPPEPVHLEWTLTVKVPDGVVEEMETEVARLRRLLHVAY